MTDSVRVETITTSWATIDSIVLPKRGHTVDECEDAIGVQRSDAEIGVAVADGATETAYARPWSQLLVEVGASLEGKQRSFKEVISHAREQFAARLMPSLSALPWYAVQKIEEGAYATMLALHITAARTWQAEAVGDVTLFHLRQDDLVRAWPYTSAESFTTRPGLIPSRPQEDAEDIQRAKGAWVPGDVLLVSTDALAAYLLQDAEVLRNCARGDERRWHALFDEARTVSMKNDDVALVRVRLGTPTGR